MDYWPIGHFKNYVEWHLEAHFEVRVSLSRSPLENEKAPVAGGGGG